jgi:hypothetical protein
LNPNNTVGAIPSLARVGRTLNSWDEWVIRWNDEAVTFSEQMGLLHSAFDIKLEAGDPRAVTRLSFLLRLANSATQSRVYRDSGGEKLAEKARNALVAKVIRSEALAGLHLSLVYDGPGSDELLPLMVGLFCDRDERGWGNWSYVQERSEGDYVNFALSGYFTVLVRYLIKSSGHNALRSAIIKTCFLEAPTVFCDILGRASHLFSYNDFREFIEWLGSGRVTTWPLSTPDMIMSGQVQEFVLSVVEEKTGGRLIRSQIRHWDVFILFATRAQEDLLRMEAASS